MMKDVRIVREITAPKDVEPRALRVLREGLRSEPPVLLLVPVDIEVPPKGRR